MTDKLTLMSQEIYNFSNLIDENFDFVEEVKTGFLSYILSFFR